LSIFFARKNARLRSDQIGCADRVLENFRKRVDARSRNPDRRSQHIFRTVAKHFVTANGSSFRFVIKADGLALGKGVIIAPDAATARSTIDAMMSEGRFGDAGRRIVIEEFLRGSECSLHALVDGKNYRLLESARDHKRVYDGDLGRTRAGWALQSGQQLERRVGRSV